MMKRVALLALLACALQSQAQTTTPPSLAKKELVQKLLVLQRPGLEGLARNLVERPAARLVQDAGRLLQTEVPEAKREEVGKAIQADVKKYLDDTVPMLTDRAVKLAPSTLGAALEEKFSEDELKQLLAWFESPVNKKYQQVIPEVQDGFVQKLVGDSRDVIEPKIKALENSVGKRLGVIGNAATPPAKGASAPAKKK
jgi:hypothetical protein